MKLLEKFLADGYCREINYLRLDRRKTSLEYSSNILNFIEIDVSLSWTSSELFFYE